MKSIAMLLTIGLTACSTSIPAVTRSYSSQSFPSRPERLSRSEISHWLDNHMGERYNNFTSRGGKFRGMDSDAELSFISKKEVKVTEYGNAPQTYYGTYSVDKAGAIQVQLMKYQSKWPSMYLWKSKAAMMLMPINNDPSFRMGGRGDATESPEIPSYWPFYLSGSPRHSG